MDQFVDYWNVLTPWFNDVFWNNEVHLWLKAIGTFLVLMMAFHLFEHVVLSRLERFVQSTKNDLDDELVKVIKGRPEILFAYGSFYLAIEWLTLPSWLTKTADGFLIVLLVYWGTSVVSDVVEYMLNKYAKRKGHERQEHNSTFFAISILVKLTLWSIALLVILSNVGVDISALVASLGIGGIAIALAVQNILSDLFSSFSIYFDKPFEVNDFVVLGEHSGTIKRIGLKTTRIQALGGEELVLSNHELTTTRIQNFKRMKRRRILFSVGVTYDTTSKQLNKIPDLVKDIIDKVKLADFDRAHFKSFGDFSLNIEIVYFLNSREYVDYMDTQQEINLAIKDAFEKEKIEMAFPTQTVYVQKG